MQISLTELIAKGAGGPLVMDDGRIRIQDQAQMLIDDAGTGREWVAIGLNDVAGFAEVVALAHPINAALIVHAVNIMPKLIAALTEAHAALSDIINAPGNGEPYTPEELASDSFGKPLFQAWKALEEAKTVEGQEDDPCVIAALVEAAKEGKELGEDCR